MTEPETLPRGPSRGALLAALVGLNVLWAPVNFWVKIAAGSGLAGVTLGLARWSLLALILPLLLAIPKFREVARYKPLPPRLRLSAFAIGLCFFGPAHLLYYTSLPRTSSVEGTVLLTTAPLWTTLLSVLMLGERATARRWAALALAIAGAYVTAVGFGVPKIEGTHLVGNAMFFTGVLFECLNGVLAVRISRASSGIGTLAWQIAGAVPAFLLAVLFLRPPMPHPGPAAFGALAYLVIVSGAVTFCVWYVLTERAPLSLMVLPIGLQPPLSALLGAAFLGERLKADLLIGAAIILLALAIGFLERQKNPSPSAKEAKP